MKRKTMAIERYHVHGTDRHNLSLLYRGIAHRVIDRGYAEYSVNDDQASLDLLRNYAKAYDATHIRYTGDWTKKTKPKGGAL